MMSITYSQMGQQKQYYNRETYRICVCVCVHAHMRAHACVCVYTERVGGGGERQKQANNCDSRGCVDKSSWYYSRNFSVNLTF